jgi:hypothetical protein
MSFLLRAENVNPAYLTGVDLIMMMEGIDFDREILQKIEYENDEIADDDDLYKDRDETFVDDDLVIPKKEILETLKQTFVDEYNTRVSGGNSALKNAFEAFEETAKNVDDDDADFIKAATSFGKAIVASVLDDREEREEDTPNELQKFQLRARNGFVKAIKELKESGLASNSTANKPRLQYTTPPNCVNDCNLCPNNCPDGTSGSTKNASVTMSQALQEPATLSIIIVLAVLLVGVIAYHLYSRRRRRS